jgi:drug/metabolite transporter (DMT)-like permease
MPAAGLGNVVIALLARFWLHDSISLERWAGILLITVGVGFVAQGPSLTERPTAEAPAPATVAEPVLGKEQAR